MKNNYLIGVSTLRSWYAFFLIVLMSAWLPGMSQSKLSNYGTYSSPSLSYSSTGAGGWSAPGGVILGGGFQHAGGATVHAAFPAQPGTAYPHYTYGPTEYGWNVYNGATPGNITIYGLHASMPPGYGILTQTINGFSSGGWAGWSVPAGKVILGGGFEANGPVAVSAPAGPNTVWPHYTYGANEYGWVVQSAGATSITIHAIYADMPHGYEIVKSVALNYSGNGWAGWSQQNGKVVTGGGFELPGPAAASRPGLPSQTTPFGYTYASDEYGWLVQNGGTAGTGYIYAIYASQQFPVEIFRNGNFVSGHMTIQGAVNAAQAGDVIEVIAGSYNETVTIDKALTVRGPNHTVVGYGTRSAEAIVRGGFVMNGVSNVTVSGFSVTGNNVAGSRGILLGNTGSVAGPVTLSNNIIENWTTGISLAGGASYPWVSGVTVSGNLIRNNTAGIGSTENVAGLAVSNNTFNGNAEGIGLGPGLTGLSVSGNTFASSNSSHIADYGSGTMPAYAALFAGNTFGNAAAVSATNGNDYTTQSIYNTIGSAVSNAAIGATITVTAGTYNESITIDKRLTLDGAGSTTIINTTTSGAKAITVTASGASASSRLVIRDMAFTGPSNTSGSDAISFEPAGAGAYVTVENVSSTAHGQGVHFRSGTMTDAKILNCTLNGNGFGVRVASAVTSMDGLVIDGCTMNNNNSSAISVNPSGTLSNVNTNYTISNTTFANNSTAGVANQHDLSFFGFTGNATLSNLTLSSGNGTSQNSNSYGIVFTRGSGSGPLGTVSLNNVIVSGHVGKGAITFQLYSDISGVSMNNVDVSNCVAPWGQVILSHTDADAFALGNTTLKSLVLWTTGGADATSAVYKHATTNAVLDRNVLADCFQMEDQTVHKTDNASLGLVRLKSGNMYVTTTSGSIQRGIDAASGGDILNVGTGTFTENLTVNKRLDIRGVGNATVVQAASGNIFSYVSAGSGASSTNRSYLRDLKILGSGVQYGLRTDVVVDYLTITGVSFESTNYAVHVNNTGLGTMQDWEISNCTFTGNVNGYRSGQSSKITGLSITGCQFINGTTSAIYSDQKSPAGNDYGILDNVTITNNTFTGNSAASNNNGAIYLEKLSNAVISGNTFVNNGTPTNPRGIIANFKFQAYSGVNISNNTFTESRSSATSGYGLFLAGRNDGGTYGPAPATLSNLTVSANEISGFRIGISLENNITASTATVSNNKLSDCYLAFNYSGANAGSTLTISDNSFTGATLAVTNQTSGTSVVATCNWFGTLNANTIASTILGTVSYSPWLVSGTDGNAATGFQPSGACTGTAPSIASSVTNVSCFGLANGAINITASGGSAPYTYEWNSGSTDEDRSGLVAGTYTVTVTDANLSTVSTTVTVTQPAIPTPAGVISGIATECRSGVAASEPFSVPTSTNATTYTWAWTGTSGVTISNNGSQNITLDYTATAIQGGVIGTLMVTPYDVCGNAGTSRSVAVEYQGTAPVTPASISGDGKLCPGDVKTYSIATVSRATSYTWNIPANTSVPPGSTTNIIQLTVGAGYNGGDITVTASNVCGTSPARTKSVVTNLPVTPGVITGLTSGQCNASGVTYSIAPVTGATSYSWTSSGSIQGSASGSSIGVNWPISGTSGNVSVSSVNACGTSSARSLTVSLIPTRPDPITGVINPACVNSSAAIATNTVTGASSYTWQATSGGAITGGQGLKNTIVTWGASAATSQAVTVRASNSCGTSLSRAFAGITVNACPPVRLESAGSAALDILVYPNPAHDFMMVNFTVENEQRYQIRLTDMSGRAVLVQDGTSDAGSNQLQLTPGSISTGVYMLHLTIGDQQAVQRIVVE